MDFTTCDWDPQKLLVGKGGRDPSKTAQALAEGFCRINRPIFRLYNISAEVIIVKSSPKIRFVTSGFIGAFPLRSPVTGQYEIAGVIEPWIKWDGVGPMLTTMGMKRVPELVRLPLLPRSAREIPGWVIGSVVVTRVESLLKSMVRKYELEKNVMHTPKGRVNWQEYAIKHLPRYDMLGMPCEFPTLKNNDTLMSVIHYTLRKLQGELYAERQNGSIVAALLNRISELLIIVSGYVPLKPSGRMLQQCFYSKINIAVLEQGLEAMRWCAEDRGLGGLSELNGLAWRMSMPHFYETYVEVIATRALRYIGGHIKSDRLNETKIPIAWYSNKYGMMRSLRPDFVINRNDATIIVDAKFKRYGQVQRHLTRLEMNQAEQDEQRHDIHQVLAYAACYPEHPITICLVYPTSEGAYRNRLAQGSLHLNGKIDSGGRTINLIVTYVPLKGKIDDVAKEFGRCISNVCVN